jgi:hypothetical protein
MNWRRKATLISLQLEYFNLARWSMSRGAIGG